ncbi:EGF-like domain-containing protein [Cavenderia fasciculata]|uniref:EGF-like domain-containing protein n=1 Tax=Cavenderia fasciculata TaxID=261658 RepID=F4Q8Z7_CACFS|nr:EGF-like domain-containing protein [Cavenderia fasciculata]EGG15166.1 EGF-like domain-containing protein [Cavenderia fasciculata]|eukprot:XP_004351886.1 EGF-like domain-containing protein [Cavenderia fasciculata]
MKILNTHYYLLINLCHLNNRIAIYQGLVLDPVTHKLSLTGRYNTSVGRTQGNAFLIEIDTQGPLGFVEKLEFFGENRTHLQFNIKYVNGLVGIAPGGRPVVVMPRFRANPTVSLYDPSTKTYTDLIQEYSAQFKGFVNGNNPNEFFGCGYQGIKKYSPLTPGVIPTSVPIMSFLQWGDCAALSKQGNTLYFVHYEYLLGVTKTHVMTVPDNCNNCTSATTLFAVDFQIQGFATHKAGNRVFVYYSSQDAMYRVPLDNVAQPFVLVQEQWIQSIVADDQFVYYTTSDQVKKVSQQTTVTSTLYDPSNQQYLKTSTCNCVNGFTGSDCQTCAGGTVQWNYGEPFCVPFLADGSVSSCTETYHCLSGPYAYCYYNSCICKSSFSGPRCDQCVNGTVMTCDLVSDNKVNWLDHFIWIVSVIIVDSY